MRCFENEGILSLCIYVHRMSQEQQTAVDWMTVPRSGLLGLYRETAVQAAVVTTAVHLTPTRPSSTNPKQVRFGHLLNMWQYLFYTVRADFLVLVSCPLCRLRGLGQPSYDLLLEQSSANAVHDPGVQKCTLQVSNYAQKCLWNFTCDAQLLKFFQTSLQFKLGVWGIRGGSSHQYSLPAAKAVCPAADQ